MNKHKLGVWVFLLALILTVVPVYILKAEEAPSQKKEEKTIKSSSYDEASWSDINRRREEKRQNFLLRIFSYIFRLRKVESATGENVTVVETATYSKQKAGEVAPVGIVAASSDKS